MAGAAQGRVEFGAGARRLRERVPQQALLQPFQVGLDDAPEWHRRQRFQAEFGRPIEPKGEPAFVSDGLHSVALACFRFFVH